MPRGAKGARPAKADVAAKRPVVRKARDSRVHDLEKRLAEALKREAEALEQQTATAEVLQTRNRELAEAQEQQTATSEILRVIGSSPTDAQPVFETIARSGVSVCAALGCVVFVVDGDMLRAAATHGVRPERVERFRRDYPIPLSAEIDTAQTVRSRRIFHLADIEHNLNATASDVEYARLAGYRTRLMVPMVRGDRALGLIAVTREDPTPFPEQLVELLGTFADQAVIAIENVRLFKELETRNKDLSEALEQQTATGEILRVIASSPTDLQPVMEAVVENAARVCGATNSSILRLEGENLRIVARHGSLRWSQAVGDTVPVRRDRLSGRALIDRRTIHIEDILAAEAEFADTVSTMKQAGSNIRTGLATPLLREGMPLGVIVITRGPDVDPFSAKQVALLETFANQAVIAIENVRLFTELEARNAELAEALTQQTATSEVLGVISRSPTDIQPVLDTVVESAARLCEAYDASLLLRRDNRLVIAAHHGPIHDAPAARALGAIVGYTLPLDRGTIGGRTVLGARTVHIADVQVEAEEFPEASENARRLGFHTMLSVPLMREGVAIGAIQLPRTEVRLFTERQVALLKTFADQAVIAIENVRLFTELEGKNLALTKAHAQVTEALDQQTATSEILRVISSSPTDVQPVFEAIVENAARLFRAWTTHVFGFDGQFLHLGAVRGPIHHSRSLAPIQPSPDLTVGRCALARSVIHIADVEGDPDASQRSRQIASLQGWRSALAAPMMRDGQLSGVIMVTRASAGAFDTNEIELLKTFADQAVIAIENVRLFTELGARNRELTEALEQQTATAEILRVISSSPTDIQPVMDVVAESAARVCGATDSLIFRLDGDVLRLVTVHGPMRNPPGVGDSVPVTRDTVTGRAVSDRRTIHVEDMLALPETEFPETRARQRRLGYTGGRTVLATPLLREGVPVGAIVIRRAEAQPFSTRQIALLETFADQAVIAIENVRLFTELQARTEQLTRSVEKLTALGEVSRALSSTLDLEAVLQAIVSRASQLAGADGCAIYEYTSGSRASSRCLATHNLDASFVEAIRASPLRKGEGRDGPRHRSARTVADPRHHRRWRLPESAFETC